MPSTPMPEGLRNRLLCRNHDADELMPQYLLTIREAIDEPVSGPWKNDVQTVWSDAEVIPVNADWAGGRAFVDRRCQAVAAPVADVYRAACRPGGGQGHYAAHWLWRLRGKLDRLVGGPGLRQIRRDPENVAFGESLDSSRVTAVERNRWLQLRGEMRLPGEALLDFHIRPRNSSPASSLLIQTARFKR
ncbi:MAG: DUF2867 domain-containing protein [Planctomycetota bacterium]